MKKGPGLKRTSPLTAKSPPKQRATALPMKNAARQKKRAETDEVYGSFFRYVKTLPCAVGGEGSPCMGPVTGHHLRSVGAGGKDAANLSPLCQAHHQEIHTIGPKRFDAKYFNDLHLYAGVIHRRWLEGFEEEGA